MLVLHHAQGYRNTLVEITACEIEALISVRDILVSSSKTCKGKLLKTMQRDIRALSRLIKKSKVETITEFLMVPMKACPYGKEDQRTCTPTRADECYIRHICGKNRRKKQYL
jgi:hypothetical protein